MRKTLYRSLLLATLAVLVASVMAMNDGYALIVWSHWRVEMSLNFLILVLLAMLLAGALLLKLLHGTVHLPGRLTRWRAWRHQRRGQRAFLLALRALFEGHYEKTIKAATRARKLGFAAGYADLLAAHAAQGLGDTGRMDVWLGRVDADDASLNLARLQQEATMKLGQRQFEPALLALQVAEQQGRGRRSTDSLRTEINALLGSERWAEALLRLRNLRRRDGLPPDFIADAYRQAHLGNLRGFTNDSERFSLYLGQIPPGECSPELLTAAAALLETMPADSWTAQAQKLIEAARRH